MGTRVLSVFLWVSGVTGISGCAIHSHTVISDVPAPAKAVSAVESGPEGSGPAVSGRSSLPWRWNQQKVPLHR
jgi:hypothetical protein